MSIKLPWFKLNPTEWLSSEISDESDAIQGAFLQIMCHYWSNDCKLSESRFRKKFNKKKVEYLLEIGIVKIIEGQISIPLLDSQYAELSEKHAKRVDAGQRGGIASVKKRSSNASSIPNQEEENEYKIRGRPSFDDFLSYAKNLINNEREFVRLSDAIKIKYNEWVSNGWVGTNGYPIKNWKTYLSNSIKFLRTNEISTTQYDLITTINKKEK